VTLEIQNQWNEQKDGIDIVVKSQLPVIVINCWQNLTFKKIKTA